MGTNRFLHMSTFKRTPFLDLFAIVGSRMFEKGEGKISMPMVGNHPNVTMFGKRKKNEPETCLLACFMNVNVNRIEDRARKQN